LKAEDENQNFQEKDGTECGTPTCSTGALSGMPVSNVLRGKQGKGFSSLLCLWSKTDLL